MGNLKTGVHLSIVLRIREDLLDNNNNNKNHLLISNARIIQEWQLNVNIAMILNQRFSQQKLTLHKLQI
jgi:hypothetical protein